MHSTQWLISTYSAILLVEVSIELEMCFATAEDFTEKIDIYLPLFVYPIGNCTTIEIVGRVAFILCVQVVRVQRQIFRLYPMNDVKSLCSSLNGGVCTRGLIFPPESSFRLSILHWVLNICHRLIFFEFVENWSIMSGKSHEKQKMHFCLYVKFQLNFNPKTNLKK